VFSVDLINKENPENHVTSCNIKLNIYFVVFTLMVYIAELSLFNSAAGIVKKQCQQLTFKRCAVPQRQRQEPALKILNKPFLCKQPGLDL
jgi:hypothetical protein